ncbi:hypothetical protein [Schnuerera sp.]|uniref:hypothetical protein n=1 Tax=Schnuerera sp. TaxID=2794844 RepID=UPI002BE1EEB1|nr:hypothetical protein [Schnuerera sp.]HSH35034.1 hypothetical protein [Schnuerera sp.]
MLRLARDEDLTDIITEDDSNPIITQHPIEGSSETKQFYLFNENPDKRYEDVVVRAEGEDSDWFEFSLDGNTFTSEIQVGDIEEANSGQLIYIRVTTTEVDDSQNRDNTEVKLIGTQFAV